jgi:hypothetical protein
MCSQNAGNAISETQTLKISWACPHSNSSLRPYGTRLTPSAIAYFHGGGGGGGGGGEDKENGPSFGSLPHH